MTFTQAEMTNKMYDAVICGGGASGLFCAVTLAMNGKKVLLAEHSDKTGRKLRITGKGRCNVTNNCEVTEVLKNIPRNPRFLYSSLYGFTPYDTINFFESIGIPLKTERGNRVFPVSDKASDIADGLEEKCRAEGVKIVYDNIISLKKDSDKVIGLTGEKGEYTGENVIIATGGKSYPKTGSTGDGYRFAQSVGHTVTEITPSLCPIEVKEKQDCVKTMGLSLKNCKLSLYRNNEKKPVFQEMGEMLFTHFGLSGPLVLSASAHIENMKENSYRVSIDMKPALSSQQLDNRILRDFGEFPNRDFGNSLNRLLPSKIIPVVIERCGIEPTKKVNQVSREERIRLVECIKSLDFTFRNFRSVDEAIITRGGVNVKEIDPKSMESKIVKHLYFIGEILDTDGYTGGFNLQIAFSTAYACAKHIIESEE